MESLTVKRLLRALWVLLGGSALLAALYLLMPLVYPLLLAWLLAFLIHPLVLRLKVWRLPGWLAVCLALILYIGSAGLVITALITKLVKELIVLAQTLSLHTEEWRRLLLSWSESRSIRNIISQIEAFYQSNPGYHATIDSNISRTTGTLGALATRVVGGFFNAILQLISSLPSFGTVLGVVVLAAFFLATGWERHNRMLAGIIPATWRDTAEGIWAELRKSLLGYFTAQLILLSITATLVILGLALLGVDSAFAIGLMISVVDLLPYLGVGAVLIPWALLSYMSGQTGLAAGLAALFAVVLITRQLLEPKVLGSSIGVDPLAMLIVMFAGLQLFGAVGLLFGPVALVVLGALHRAGVFRSLRSYIATGRPR
ncbi:sporulation integral membrane protein YtvI [Paenibacillus spiritus]|uniref:Sporulation integral membrane protein YtvI n=1 Tax=Paenibacillus spiritus TaxID=2496557 RepID=A0A5J5G0B1_9BACL|nr:MULTISPECIES: sporulation integral membrane protein YtvI [Paenibacillus]KAA8999726.1 sporulation integral membrane protein YtvI [Paenibacillus spiritus]